MKKTINKKVPRTIRNQRKRERDSKQVRRRRRRRRKQVVRVVRERRKRKGKEKNDCDEGRKRVKFLNNKRVTEMGGA